MTFAKATKKQAKLRAAFFGPSGAGKTYSALRIAAGMGGRVGVIDTERGSASKYADKFTFDVCHPANNTIESYLAAINEAAVAGYDVLIIDSLSHAWQELLQEVDRLKGSFGGNKWSAWSIATPKQQSLVDAILAYPGHVIATMRSRTEWAQETNDRGKATPVRVGLAPEQRQGMEYEFDVLVGLTPGHIATVIKDRSGRFQDETYDKPGEEFGKALAEWLDQGEPDLTPRKKQLMAKVATYLKERQSNVSVGAFIKGAAQQLLGRTHIDTTDELDTVETAIHNGAFDLATGDWIPTDAIDERTR